jgi:hypothetical protein
MRSNAERLTLVSSWMRTASPDDTSVDSTNHEPLKLRIAAAPRAPKRLHNDQLLLGPNRIVEPLLGARQEESAECLPPSTTAAPA